MTKKSVFAAFGIQRFTLAVLAAASLGATLSACVPLVVGGAAVGTALVVTDRRTSGAQLVYVGIEWRSSTRVR